MDLRVFADFPSGACNHDEYLFVSNLCDHFPPTMLEMPGQENTDLTLIEGSQVEEIPTHHWSTQ